MVTLDTLADATMKPRAMMMLQEERTAELAEPTAQSRRRAGNMSIKSCEKLVTVVKNVVE